MTTSSNPIVNTAASLHNASTALAASETRTLPHARVNLPALPEPNQRPIARPLNQFLRPVTNDPGELIKHRFLCRGGGLLLVGQTGLGKSSLAMQLMIKLALGQPVFGLEPTRPIKSLLVQAENDDGDLGEMKCGVFRGMNLSAEEQELASRNILVWQESSKSGAVLCDQVLDPLLSDIKPDMIWLDPALAYLGGDMSSQKDVGRFLRNEFGPLLKKHDCGAVIIHHTNKINRDPEKQMTDVSYLGAGSAEWINWSRAMLVVRKTDVDNLYELTAAKRGNRLNWKMADGESLGFTKYLGHSREPDTICWNEMTIAMAEELQAGGNKTAADVLKHVPHDASVAKTDLITTCQQNGIGKNLANTLIAELVDEEYLYERQVARANKRPKVFLSREPATPANPATRLQDGPTAAPRAEVDEGFHIKPPVIGANSDRQQEKHINN